MQTNHKCHFHPQQPITKFCPQKQCTLPLCPECEPIHLEEHTAQHQTVSLLSFKQAYQLASEQIENFLSSEKRLAKQYEKQLERDKESVITFIQNYYSSATKALELNKKKNMQLEEKLNKLKKGSIKTLIFYFAGDIVLQQQPQPFTPLFQHLTSTSNNNNPKQQSTPLNHVYQTYTPMPKEYLNAQSTQTAKLHPSNSFEHANVFNSIDEIKLAQKNREKQRKSIFDNPKKTNIVDNSKPQTRSPSNKYNYNVTPTVQSNQALKFQSTVKQSPPLHRDYTDDFKAETKQKPEHQPETPVSFQNRYKFAGSGSEQYEAYKKQKEEKILRQSQELKNKEDKENSYPKMLKTSDLDLNNYPPKPSSSLTPTTSQRMRSFSQNVLITHQTDPKLENPSYDLKKQVFSPEEIRKMLEKRIEERNRILSIKKAENYAGQATQAQCSQKKGWETRDSIINQIYNDSKN